MNSQLRWFLAAAIVPLAVSQAPIALAQQTKVTPLMAQPLPGFAGPEKEGSVAIVEFPPGSSSMPHRHNAHVFVYVLEGSIVMQVKGGQQVTLKAGDTFYENPDDIHIVSKNASATEPAKILTFFVKDKGAPTTVPAN
ncbi:MAG: cupin domain-containing protein [Xanthobacteraceae bacterium]